MSYSVAVYESWLERTITFTAPTADEAVSMVRSWGKPSPTVGELIQARKPKPPTQGVLAQGFEAFGQTGAKPNGWTSPPTKVDQSNGDSFSRPDLP